MRLGALRPTRRAALLGAAASLLAAPPARARQTAFRQRPLGSEIELSYEFLDYDRRPQAVSFRVPAADVRESDSIFRDFSFDGFWAEVERALREGARGEGLAIDIRRKPQGLEWSLSGRSPDLRGAAARIEEAGERAQQRYLSRTLRHDRGDGRVFVDYRSATRRFAPALKGAADALAAQTATLDARGKLARALALVQTVPYDRLGDRGIGAGYLAPPSVFAQNRGDCDSKSTALAAILSHLLPRAPLAMALMPEHAILAVGVPAMPGDRSLRLFGKIHVVVEAAGPYLWPVGRVEDRTMRDIDRGSDTIFVELT